MLIRISRKVLFLFALIFMIGMMVEFPFRILYFASAAENLGISKEFSDEYEEMIKETWFPSIPMSVWVWESWFLKNGEYYNQNAIESILNLCMKRNIKTIFLPVDMPVSENLLPKLLNFLKKAHEMNIRIEASAGVADWALKENHPGALKYIDALLQFNKEHPKEEQFDGYHNDSEPWTLFSRPDFKLDSKTVHAQFIELLQEINKRIKSIKVEDPGFTFGVVVGQGAWDPGESEKNSYQVQDITDYVAVLAYNNTGINAVGIAKKGIEYADKIGKKVWIAQETDYWTGEDNDSYPGWEGMSYCVRGELEFRKTIDLLNKTFANNRGYNGIGIEREHSYRFLCLIQEEIENDSKLYGKIDSQVESLKRIPALIEEFNIIKTNIPAVKTTFNINPTLKPGGILSFNLKFDWFGSYAPVWLGFLDSNNKRGIQIDFARGDIPDSGSMGLRIINSINRYESKDQFRISYSRFPNITQYNGKVLECRIYFTEDSRIMIKVIHDDKVLWKSERIKYYRTKDLSKMYIEVLNVNPGGKIEFNKNDNSIHLHSEGGNEPAYRFNVEGQIYNIMIGKML